MKGYINNKLGEIQIGPDVIAMYAGTTAVECFGIVGMAAVSMKDGLVKLFKTRKSDARNQREYTGQPYHHRLPCHRSIWNQYFGSC